MCSVCRLVSLCETTKPTDLINSVDRLCQPSSLRSCLRHYWRFVFPNVNEIGSRGPRQQQTQPIQRICWFVSTPTKHRRISTQPIVIVVSNWTYAWKSSTCVNSRNWHQKFVTQSNVILSHWHLEIRTSNNGANKIAERKIGATSQQNWSSP